MKKLIIVSVIMALMLLMGGSFATAHAQDPTKEEKPTFYRLIPGTYVNGWPRFTIHYPKDWIEMRPIPLQSFRASTPGSTQRDWFYVTILSNPIPLDKVATIWISYFRNVAADVTVVSDKPSRLRDGTLAWETEFQMVMNSLPCNYFIVATKKGDLWIFMGVGSYSGKIGEDLRAIPYSIEFQPGKDEPVKVPPDVQEFLERNGNDFLSHDVAKVMAHYSDRYLNSGVRKGEVERNIKQWINSWMSSKGVTTDFIPAGDRAYLAGFVITNSGTFPMPETSIIKENGEWKWYGNQRDVSP
jgi:hypothetical protein